jgi:molecular chaperone GrpE (heat shock protein)
MLLGIVDVIDEIELMKTSAAAAEHGGLSAVQDRLRDLVELSGGELIRETSWQPTLQRAVKVEPAEPGQTDVRHLQTLATGLRHAGRIIRKQEVIISQPKP